jgi:hypothetical protein
MLSELEQGSILQKKNAESSTHYHNALNARKPLKVSISPRSEELELYTLKVESWNFTLYSIDIYIIN